MNDSPIGLDETHDPARRSWLRSANEPGCDFPIQNLPLGMFTPPGEEDARAGVAIGDQIVDLAACCRLGLLPGINQSWVSSASLNALLAQGNAVARQLRGMLGHLLDGSETQTSASSSAFKATLHAANDCRLHLPTHIGDYTDFYAGIHHARAAGTLMAPDKPLARNYKWVPIAYHGRASSVRVGGGEIVRPNGQRLLSPDADPTFGPSRRLDLELELGIFVGSGNALGEPISIRDAASHIAGFCLLNDWSARDLQFWEMFPLGPFLGKSFATSISPWLITTEALRPFRAPAMKRPEGDPQPLPHLLDDGDQASGGLRIDLEVRFSSERMRLDGLPFKTAIISSSEHLYWTPAQMVAHHTSNGCDLHPGDLIGTGTISGPRPDQLGSFLELTEGGKCPVVLADGETRTFLEDGDTVELHGLCRREGFVPIGFGPCIGKIAAAKLMDDGSLLSRA